VVQVNRIVGRLGLLGIAFWLCLMPAAGQAAGAPSHPEVGRPDAVAFSHLTVEDGLSQDHERRLQSAEALIKFAMVHLMLRRLVRYG
jgi:hypothetical protein